MLVIIAAIIVTVAGSVGAAVAYIVREAPGLENEFTPVEVSAEVLGMDSAQLSGVTVKNTGDISAYIRVSAVAVYVGEGGRIHSSAPVLGVDYSLSVADSGWQTGSDGYLYYTDKVASGESTSAVFSSVERLSEPPSGYKLSIGVYASAIQAEPSLAVIESWGVSVLDGGKISAP